tara:strand:+ start:426 stop:896 length:471 start_codon:yes stop_codon:yes gene_type:complete
MCKNFILTFILLFTLSSCETPDNNRLLGKIIGSGLGALVGFQFGSGVGGALFIAGGTVLGGYIGNEIAEELSESEISEYGNATKDALDKNINNESIEWTNKDKTKLGKITPLNRYNSNKSVCRDIEQKLTFHGLDGKERSSISTFCKNNKGNWQII